MYTSIRQLASLLTLTVLFSAGWLAAPAAGQASTQSVENLPGLIAEAIRSTVEQVQELAEPGAVTGPIFLNPASFEQQRALGTVLKEPFNQATFLDDVRSALRQSGTTIAQRPVIVRGVGEVVEQAEASRRTILDKGISLSLSRVALDEGSVKVDLEVYYSARNAEPDLYDAGAIFVESVLVREGGQWQTKAREIGYILP